MCCLSEGLNLFCTQSRSVVNFSILWVSHMDGAKRLCSTPMKVAKDEPHCCVFVSWNLVHMCNITRCYKKTLEPCPKLNRKSTFCNLLVILVPFLQFLRVVIFQSTPMVLMASALCVYTLKSWNLARTFHAMGLANCLHRYHLQNVI